MKLFISLMLCLIISITAFAKSRVADTPHNLSITGPGQLKSQTEDQICAFCHTPHKPGKGKGLWNRNVNQAGPSYQSPTGDAVSAGSQNETALCQSCHDGTIALGEMLNPPRGRISNDLRDTRLHGRGKFGVSLNNHHPVGIEYNLPLYANDSNLLNPDIIDLPLKNGILQCTTCHNPHGSNFPPFLNKPNLNGELCLSCHNPSGDNWEWATSAHAISDATPRGPNPWSERKQEWRGKTVAENACENCHATHNARTPQNLIKDVEERTCHRCHNGSVAEFNVQVETQKFYRHPVERPAPVNHQSSNRETVLSLSLTAECEDCHNPHASREDSPMISVNPANPSSQNHTTAPFANGVIAGVSGIDIGGRHKDVVEYEYEVCLKCHGRVGRSACENRRCSTATNYQMNRQDNVYNLREKIDPGNPALISYHPIDTNNPANDSEVPSLRLDTILNRHSSRIYCSDCHAGENSPAAGGRGPAGPHGSRHEAILTLGYELKASARFNVSTSTLCFKCHDAGSLFSDISFKHRLHVLEEGNSCVNCHDPHGSAIYPHLINFLVSSSTTGQLLEITGAGMFNEPVWEDNGRYSGTCYLSCHGAVHDGAEY